MRKLLLPLLLCTTRSSGFAVLSHEPACGMRNGACLGGTAKISTSSSVLLLAKPKSGSIVDSYQTVSVNCAKCRTRLFRYKKKNGTKSNLVKCYVERIVDDSAGVLEAIGTDSDDTSIPIGTEFECPECGTRFARSSLIHGRPALKFVGGKIRMTKK